MPYHEIDAIQLGEILRNPIEIAVIDLRTSVAFGNGAPLHGANIPFADLVDRIEQRVPHKHTRVALVDGDGTLVAKAADQLLSLGYVSVYGLRGGTDYSDRLPVIPIRIAAPRVISGEIERRFETPVTTPIQLVSLREAGHSVVVFDTRSVEEYVREHIPDSYPAPGGEVVQLFHALVDSPGTHVIMTCAGRSRAVLAAQTLISAGVPNPVSTLDFGTLGWRDAGLELAHGLEKELHPLAPEDIEYARDLLSPVTTQFDVFTASDLEVWQSDSSRTTYALDVRLPEAFERGHLPGSVNAPAGQLGIFIGKWVAVQRARLALIDDRPGIRAVTVGRWLARLGWEIAIVEHDFAR